MEIVSIILNNKIYFETCRNINKNYAEDIYQEVIEQLLTMPTERLPSKEYLQFWFYCTARNIISQNGKLGKLISKDFPTDIQFEIIESEQHCEVNFELDIKKIETFLLGLNEFENRIVLLYAEYKSMRKISQMSDISYSALRSVKEKIKKFANENINNNT
jgi:DNA-directed RNA polymerase specialized sigma24 family protein